MFDNNHNPFIKVRLNLADPIVKVLQFEQFKLSIIFVTSFIYSNDEWKRNLNFHYCVFTVQTFFFKWKTKGPFILVHCSWKVCAFVNCLIKHLIPIYVSLMILSWSDRPVFIKLGLWTSLIGGFRPSQASCWQGFK